MPAGYTTIEGETDGRAAKTATVWLLEPQTEMMDCSTPDTSAPNLGTLRNTYNPRRLNSKGEIKNSGDCVWFKVPNLANNRSASVRSHRQMGPRRPVADHESADQDLQLRRHAACPRRQRRRGPGSGSGPALPSSPHQIHAGDRRNLLFAGLVVGLRCRPLYHFVRRHRAGDGARDGGRAPDGDVAGHAVEP